MKKQNKAEKKEFWIAPEWLMWVLAGIMAIGVLGAVITPMLKP